MRSPLTVKAALRLPSLRAGAPEVVAGAAGLDRPIRWAHAGEVPNMPALLKGGELLLTTGMGIGRSAGAQRRFVEVLADGGAAGVVVEVRQRVPRGAPARDGGGGRGARPAAVLLRREVPFVEITEAIHTGILGHQLAVLRRGEDLHQRFTELMVSGAGIPDVLTTLAGAIADPVLLENAAGEVVYHAQRPGDAEALAAWKAGESASPSPCPARAGGPGPARGARARLAARRLRPRRRRARGRPDRPGAAAQPRRGAARGARARPPPPP